MLTLSRAAAIALLAALFAVSFLLRAYRPLSQPDPWLTRATTFNTALDAHDWAAMYQSRHPGFTTMVIAGLPLRLYHAVSGMPAQALFDWASPPYATEYGRQMVAGVMGLAFALAALIVLIAWVIRRLAGWEAALTAGGLLAFAPFYLTESRVLHVDGLLATLMLLSGLLVVLSLQEGRRGLVLLSGFVGGLALLTKVPALFLVPFTGLALLARLALKLRADWPTHAERRFGWLASEIWRGLILPGLLWLLLAILPFALWPAMWVAPAQTLRDISAGAEEHILNPHIYTRFFAGQLYEDVPPSPLFYPVTMLFNTSFVTLTLSLAALGHYTLWRRRVKMPLPPVAFWLLTAYVVFFVAQMMIGAKQVERYVLPAHLMLEVLAGIGLVGVIDLLRQAPCFASSHSPTASLLIGLAVGAQALSALPYAPDYGAHHNHLLGSNRLAVQMIEVQGQNEGITYASGLLSRLPEPDAVRLAATGPLRNSLRQYFPGEVITDMASGADFYLFSLNAMQRHLKPDQWEATWEAFQGQPPVMVVSFDGVEHLWLYAAQPAGLTQTIAIGHGGIGLIVLAWLWTAGLIAALAWALRRSPGTQRDEGRA